MSNEFSVRKSPGMATEDRDPITLKDVDISLENDSS